MQVDDLLMLRRICPTVVCIRDKSQPHADAALGSVPHGNIPAAFDGGGLFSSAANQGWSQHVVDQVTDSLAVQLGESAGSSLDQQAAHLVIELNDPGR